MSTTRHINRAFLRTWSASIEVYDPLVRRLTTVIATPSEYDLLRDQTQDAIRETVRLGLLVWPHEVHVILYKTTKARGTERYRTFYVFRDRQGVVRYQ